MVHEKYTRKNGKIYGPYLYENKRVGQKIITSYHGSHKEEKTDFNYLNYFFLVCFFLLVVLGGFFVGQKDFLAFLSPDNRLSINLDRGYVIGTLLDGEIFLKLNGG